MTQPQTIQLEAGDRATVDANGRAVVRIGPTRAGQTWRVTSAGVTVSSNTLEPTARIYLGTESPQSFQGGSYSGANDAAQCDVILHRGQYLTCVWEGADVGATATLSLYGEVQVS